jgi:hypothetical protein
LINPAGLGFCSRDDALAKFPMTRKNSDIRKLAGGCADLHSDH